MSVGRQREVVGYRAKIGLVIPSTNTVLEADAYATALDGVTFHAGRIYNPLRPTDTDEAFQAMISHLEDTIHLAVHDVMTCEPDHLIIVVDIGSFYGGVAGGLAFHDRLERLAAVPVTTGAGACRAALGVYDVRRIGVITAYQTWSSQQALDYFSNAGYDMVRWKSFPITNPRSGAVIREQQLREGLLKLDSPELDAIVQVGTNLSMVRLADEAERWLGKPVIAINAALLWHALRARGIQDRFSGFGDLFRNH